LACGGATFASNDSTHCIQAALGYAPNSSGSGQSICGAGTFRGPDQFACTPCADGLYSIVQGAATCIPCSAGTYRKGAIMRACLVCPPGSFSATAGEPTCEACPPGTSPSNDRTACVECKAGYVSFTGAQCFACTGGKTSAPGASECVNCPDWTTYLGEGRCGPCAPGKYMVRLNVDFTYACLPCPKGTYNPSSGGLNLSACVHAPCDPPSHVPNADWGATACVPCPIGYASADGLACKACPAGSYGQWGESCPLCPHDTWTGASGQSSCEPCAVGTWATAMGATVCAPCPPGTAGAGCAPCPAGTFMPDAGAVACLARTTLCSPGHIVVLRPDSPTEDNGCQACTAWCVRDTPRRLLRA
jgi:hypothetical protein